MSPRREEGLRSAAAPVDRHVVALQHVPHAPEACPQVCQFLIGLGQSAVRWLNQPLERISSDMCRRQDCDSRMGKLYGPDSCKTANLILCGVSRSQCRFDRGICP